MSGIGTHLIVVFALLSIVYFVQLVRTPARQDGSKVLAFLGYDHQIPGHQQIMEVAGRAVGRLLESRTQRNGPVAIDRRLVLELRDACRPVTGMKRLEIIQLIMSILAVASFGTFATRALAEWFEPAIPRIMAGLFAFFVASHIWVSVGLNFYIRENEKTS